ncbi:carboxypeptidase regulatory-like domain-containing protein [Fibrella sp. USSR17]
MKNKYLLFRWAFVGPKTFSYKLFLFFGLLLPIVAQAQSISGTVFRDFNSNGVYDTPPASTTHTELGLAGVEVKVFNAAGTNVTPGLAVTTTASGSYTITPTQSGPYRVELTFPASLDHYFQGFVVSSQASNVQFVTTLPATVNFGVIYPKDFCQPNPDLAVSCFVSGDPLLAGSSVADDDALVKVPFGIASASTTSPTKLATALDVGSVWGAAYQRTTKKLFTSAFLKRHVGLGKLGLGGIYVTNVTTTPTSTTYADLESLGIDLGASLLGARTLPSSGTVSNNDANVFNLVGKIGLGGLAISDDESKLYTIDLYNKQLIIMNIGNPAKSSLVAADLQLVSLPAPSCPNGSGAVRPFAVNVANGKVYVGLVCSGETSVVSSASNLTGYVYEMEPTTNVFSTSPILTIPLSYTKGDMHTSWASLGNTWSPWVTTFTQLYRGGASTVGARVGRAQPMLSNIGFTDDGDMLITMMDRGGHQLGYRNRNTTDTKTTPDTLYNGYISGDLLRARYNGSAWALESNGRVAATSTKALLTGAGVANSQGPGGGEFYANENYNDGTNDVHQETVQGGSVVVPGTNQVVTTVMDPISVWSGGFSWFSNTNGDDLKRYQVYLTVGTGANAATYGKANGLGIIAATCDPAPIQIGNRVWKDTNNNGIQDAGELPLAGVIILLKGTGLPTAGVSVTTSASGEYYFSNRTATSTAGFANSLSLTYGGSYSLTFPLSASAGTLNLSGKPNSATGTNADAIDTDASSSGLISFSLGLPGQNNFNYDVGYIDLCAIATTATASSCTPATNQYTVSGTISLTNTTAGTITLSDGVRSTSLAVTATTTSIPYSLSGLISGTGAHTLTVSLPGCGTATAVYTAPAACSVAASISVTSATVCYGSATSLTATGCNGTVTWSNSTTGTVLNTPTLFQTTSYTATCTTISGNTATAVATVTVLPQPVLNLAASSTLVTVNTPVSLSAIGCQGTVSWSSGETGTSITVTPTLATQTYSATCSTGPDCLTTASILIETEAQAVISVNSTTVCYGSTATLMATDCAGTVTWNNGTTSTSLTTPALISTTSYTATCTTATSSTFAVATVTVLDQPLLTLSASATLVTVNTPVTLTANGCTGSVTWSNGTTANTITVTPTQATQTYSTTCTTSPACFTTASITIETEEPATLVVTSTTVCYGSSATLIASGCLGTVTWSNSTTGTTLVTPALTGTTDYTATCTTATSSTFAVATVTVLEQPLLDLAASATLATTGTPVSLSAIGCSGTITWNTGATGASITVTPTQATQTYSATCTTGPDCFTTASILIETEAQAVISVNSTTVCYGSTATLMATDCAGTVTWNNGITGTSLTTPALISTTSYTATCTTATSSTFAVATVTVLDQPLLTIQASRTLVTAGTSVSLSAIGCVGTVNWSNGATGSSITVAPSSPSQTYSATCITGQDCFITASLVVETEAAAEITVSSETICYGSSGALSTSGCAGTVSWNTGATGTFLTTPALTTTTSYTATCITATSTAFAVGTVTVLPQPALNLTASSTLVTINTPVSLSALDCQGIVSWNTGATGSTIMVTPTLTTQLYSATCTTGPACFTTTSIVIETEAPADITVDSQTICYGSTAVLQANGCTGVITWSNGITATSLTIPVLTQTTSYTAFCTTATSSAFTIGTVTVLDQPLLDLLASSPLVTVNTPVSLSAIGCQGTVTWSTSAIGATIIVTPTLATQTYSATCSTGPDCLSTASILIETEEPATLTVTSATVCYGTSATLTAAGCGGTISWSNGSTGSTLVTPALTSTTDYTATCTTATSSTFAVATVTVLDQPLLSLQASATLVTTGTSISLSATGCAGTVSWNNGETGSTIMATPTMASQTYSATCTTGPGCFTTASITIETEVPAMINVNSETICYGTIATLMATDCAGTVTWNTGATGTSLTTPSLTQTTSYTAICTTATSSTLAVGTVTVLDQPLLELTASSTLVTTGTPVGLSAMGCSGTITWSTGATGASITVSPTQATQIYSATCTTGPACFTTASLVITTEEPANLIVTSATICYGSSATLTAAGCAGTISWNMGATGISLTTPVLTQTTTYTATCTTATSSTFAVGTVTVLDQPLLSLQASATLVAAGTPVSLSAIGCSGTITWSNGATGSTITVVPTLASQTYSATCTTGPACFTTASIQLLTTAALGDFVFEDVNKDGVQDSNDLPIAGATVTLLQNGSPVATTTTDASGLYSFTGLTPGTPYSVSFTTPAGFSTTTGANVGGDDGLDSDPVNGVTASLTLGAGEVNASLDAGFVRPLVAAVSYALAKSVDQSRAEKGGVVTYTISLTNTSPTTGTNVLVTDAFSTSALSVVGSATVTAGTFVASTTGGLWTIPSLAGGAVASLSFQAQINEEGLSYNVATAPDGQTATACITVPYHVCDNTPFEFLIVAPASSDFYQWSRNGIPIPGATSATYSVTQAGEYTVAGTANGCTDGTCCPVIVVADAVPSLTAVGVAASCAGSTPLNDARISLVASTTNAISYNISLGSSFTTPLLATNQSLSAVSGGVLLANQVNPDEAPGQSYTIRVYSAEGCYSDVSVVIPPTQCQCPPAVCVPFSIKKVVRK